jgi:MFS family permease
MSSSLLIIATLVSGLLVGLIPTFVDGIQSSLQSRLKLADGRVKWYVGLFYLTWLPAMPLAGWMLDSWPNKEVLFYSLVALLLGIAWLALVRSGVSLMLNAMFLGLAYSCVTTAAINFMAPEVFFPDDIRHHTARGWEFGLHFAALNFGFIAVGLGAMLGPWILRALERWWGYRQGLLYLSLALIAPAALAALCDRSQFPTPVSDRPLSDVVSWQEIVTHPHMGLMVVVILLYFALENCLEFWPESYLRELGYQDRGLQAGMFVFWLAFLATRGLAAWWFFEHPSHAFILTLVLVVLSAFVLGNLTGGFEFGSGSLGFWLLGACYGPLLPGFLGMALELYQPRSIPISVLGGLLALSGLDTLAVRPFMSLFGKDRPARSIMWAPTVLALILAAPLLLLALVPK